MSRRVLIVCGGNTCRSPMATVILERLIRTELPECAHDIIVESAGVNTVDGLLASDYARTAVHEIGLDLSAHRSRMLTEEIASRADLIIAAESDHMLKTATIAPSVADRIRMMANHDIADPFGGTLDDYRRTRDEIEQALRGTLATIAECGREVEP